MSKKSVSETVKRNPQIPEQPFINVAATGRNLRRIRTMLNLTLEEVASSFCGLVSPAAISAWELGKATPAYNYLIALGNIYGGYSLDQLIVLDYPKKEAC